jgi:hypothetical protein
VLDTQEHLVENVPRRTRIEVGNQVRGGGRVRGETDETDEAGQGEQGEDSQASPSRYERRAPA